MSVNYIDFPSNEIMQTVEKGPSKMLVQENIFLIAPNTHFQRPLIETQQDLKPQSFQQTRVQKTHMQQIHHVVKLQVRVMDPFPIA